MKKLLLTSLAGLMAFGAANAQYPTPYVGVDTGLFIANLTEYMQADAKEVYKSLSFNAGLKFNEYVGAEGFYMSTAEENLAAGDAQIAFNGIGVDVVGYYPVAEKFNAIALAGIGKYELNLLSDGELIGEIQSTGYRFGIGGEYELMDNLSARLTGKYMTAKNLEIEVENFFDVSIGVRYAF